MNLTYIFGRAGSGKTTHILEKISDAISSQKSEKVIYIVPEQFSLEAERNILSISKDGACVNATVLSFARLAHQIYKQTGGISKTVLDDSGKSMLIRKIIYDLSSELKFFSKIADKDGFVKSLSQTITELYHYEISPQTLLEFSEKSKESYVRAKINDIAEIYSNYRQFADKNFMTSDNILSFLPGKIENSDVLKDTFVFFDSFTGFTPQEYEIIRSLLKKCAGLTIALTNTTDKIYYDLSKFNGSDPLFEIKSTINKLSDIANSVNAKINKPKTLDRNLRFKDNDELLFLEQNYLSHKKVQFTKSQNAISIIKTENRYEEVNEVSKNILKLCREGNYRFNDIAILTASVSDYSNIIKSTFSKYKIPTFIDERIDILSNPITELIRSLIDISAYNYDYEAVFRFLKTNITGISRTECQYLENYALAYGIDSYKWRSLKYWQNGFVENNEAEHFIKGPFDINEIINTREKFISIVEPLVDISSKKQKAINFAKGIFEVLQNTDVFNLLENNDDSLITAQNKQIFNKICALFDKFVEILGDTELSIKEFSKIIESGLKACDIGVVPPVGDKIIVGDLERSRLPNVKALFILGVNDGVIPRLKEEDSIFSDSERNTLSEHGIELSFDSKKQTSREEFIVFKALTHPSEKLFLSYQTGLSEGKSLHPSSILTKIKELFPGIKESETEFEITLPEPMFDLIGGILIDAKKGKIMTANQLALIDWFSKSKAYGKKLDKMQMILSDSIESEKLKEETIKNLYKADIKTSASQLQKYAECPFAYFMRYNLNAKERKIYKAKQVDIGNIFHAIFDTFYAIVQKEGLVWSKLTKEQVKNLTNEVLNSQIVLDKADIMLGSEESKYRLNSIKFAAEKSLWALTIHLKNGDFSPIASELRFGSMQPLTAIRVAINDKYAFEIAGSIDRVDITSHSGDAYVKILDYKTGEMKFDPTDIYYGRQMQLILYLNALVSDKNLAKKMGISESRILPGGIFYFNIKDPSISPDESENAEEAMLTAFKLNGLVLKNEGIIGKMDERLPDQIKKSNIIPVELKVDGSLSKRSETSVRDLNDFEAICNFVMSKVASIGSDIINGEITPKPFKGKNKISACSHCEYSAVCGFGATERISKYNLADKSKKVEDIINNQAEA